jgi:hypothetical protein
MHTVRQAVTWEAAILVAITLFTARGGDAQASAFATLYSFKEDSDGASPNGVTLGKNGALYGTTQFGGTNTCGVNVAYHCGTVFELSPAKGSPWTKTMLHNFNGADGALPSQDAKVVFGSNGALYGTTAAGGSNDSRGGIVGGTVFELAPPATGGGVWTETVLYSFSNSVEAPNTPYGGVSIGPKGALNGTTYTNHYAQGFTPSGGTVFTLTPPSVPGGSWTEYTLYDLWSNGALGMNPFAGVVAAGGSLFGTSSFTNGPGSCGAVYQVSPPATAGGAWTGTAIHSFGGSDGCESLAPLTVGPGGIIYGTSIVGGSGTPCLLNYGGCGTVFQLTPPAAPGGPWTETVIHSFTALNGDGAYPAAGVVLGKNGVLYGTTQYGGSATSGSPCRFFGATGCGTVFELTPPAMPGGTWTEIILHSFTGQNGEGSIPGPLTLGPTGLLYGPTGTGGGAGKGTIFALKP